MLFFLLGAASSKAEAAIEELSLYQRTARSPIIVKGRALSSSTRRPRIAVVDVLKGTVHEETITIVPLFRDYSQPTPWLQRETFSEGEVSVLFLEPYIDDHGRGGGPGVFAVLGAADGKMPIPAEGGDAMMDAIRAFISILSMSQHDRQTEALRALMSERNPYLIEAGLGQSLRFRLGEPSDTDVLIDLLDHPRPDFRAGALGVLAHVVMDFPREVVQTTRRRSEAGRSNVFDHVAARARFDEDPRVRKEAIGVLGAFGGNPALTVIESIGSSDGNQEVRYAAQVAAHHLREKLR
jgi:hypothetical protein